jgi:site-specific recombinase XerD
MSTLAPSLQTYLTERLIGQRAASPNTIASCKPTFRLLLAFASKVTGKAPSSLDIADLDAPLVTSFLDHLERDRRNSVATRNNRLAAAHPLFGYLALHHPEHAATIARVLAVPPKQTERNLVTYLTDAEAEAVLAARGKTSWTRRRDHAMFSLAVQTGPRISELAGLTRSDVATGPGANIPTVGKGKKERRTPLISNTVAVLKAWLREQPGAPDNPLFPTPTGRHLSRDAIERRLALYVSSAAKNCRSLKAKRVTTHTLRHTAAMRLPAAGNDITMIALWLGHQQVTTTQIYLHADPTSKQRATERTRPLGVKPGRFQPSDALLAFLEAL